MITIAELKNGKVGEKIGGGFEFTIKTCKKTWQVGKKWIHQVVLMDTTGEMLADVNLGEKYNPLTRGEAIKIIVSEIQDSEKGNKLYIDQWVCPSTGSEPPLSPYEQMLAGIQSPKEIRGKILCWLVASKIQTGVDLDEVKAFLEDTKLKDVVDLIMKG